MPEKEKAGAEEKDLQEVAIETLRHLAVNGPDSGTRLQAARELLSLTAKRVACPHCGARYEVNP